MIKCPVCSELLEELTSIHCLKKHGMSKQQVLERYGKPKTLFNTFIATGSDVSGYVIHQRDYLNSQLFTDRVRSKTRKFRSDR